MLFKKAVRLVSILAVSAAAGLLLAGPLSTLLNLPYETVMRRLVTICSILGAAIYQRSIEKKRLRDWGFSDVRSAARFFQGIALGGATVAFVIIPAMLLKIDMVKPIVDRRELWETLITYPLLGLGVGLVEETFFRGFILQTLASGSVRGAVILSSLFYSGIHFIKPDFNPQTGLPQAIGLFLVGIVLAVAFLRTGSLWLSIGLHSSWVFLIRFHKVILEPIGTPARWTFFGDNILLGGPVSWIGLCLVGWWIFKRFQPAQAASR